MPNIERLKLMSLLLTEVIRGTWVPTNSACSVDVQFDLEVWGRTGECGFAACAVGHAILDFRFNQRGFHQSSLYNGAPMYKESRGWDAVAEFFDISESIAPPLFCPYYYPVKSDPELVKARVDFLIELTEADPEWGFRGPSFWKRCKEKGL